jgi:hypothetical protein
MLGYIFIYVQIKHYSGDGRQLSPLKRTLGIPCLIWEPLACYYLQYAPASKHFDHDRFEVLEAITLYCTVFDPITGNFKES